MRQIEVNIGYDFLKVQGILAVVDCGEKEGGFHCIPGFQKHIKGWANANKELYKGDRDTVQVPKDDPMRHDNRTCPIRKGYLLIWNSQLPHGNFPNDSNKPRMDQYIKMAPYNDLSIEPWTTEEYVHCTAEFNEREKKILGLIKY